MKTVHTSCDRCGREFNPEAQCAASGEIHTRGSGKEDFDLCPTCASHFKVDWLTARAVRNGLHAPRSEPVRSVGEYSMGSVGPQSMKGEYPPSAFEEGSPLCWCNEPPYHVVPEVCPNRPWAPGREQKQRVTEFSHD